MWRPSRPVLVLPEEYADTRTKRQVNPLYNYSDAPGRSGTARVRPPLRKRCSLLSRSASLRQRRRTVGELAQVDQQVSKLRIILNAREGHFVAGYVGPRVVEIFSQLLEGPAPGM